MRLVVVEGIHRAQVERSVPRATYAKGRRYAEQRAVVAMEWDAEQRVLLGRVRGHGDDYTTVVHFSVGRGGDLAFVYGDCSCPVGFSCKHAVALALTAAGASSGPARPEPAPRADTWERSLSSLLQPVGSRDGSGAVLAVELTLSRASTPPYPGAPARQALLATTRLDARLVRWGRNGWVGGGVSWSSLGSLVHHGGYSTRQVGLLQELYALHHSRGPWSPYSYGEVTTIDLAACESRQLWPLLDEAATVDVPMVYARKLGVLPPYHRTEICLDVTGREPADPLAVTPVLQSEGAEPDADEVPVRFVGTEGHGVVVVSRAEMDDVPDPGLWRFRLARLARPVAEPLQRMALEGGRLEIPAADRGRFRDEFSPQLRHHAPLVSSDESFVPPEISDPTLVLRASYGEGHDLRLDWEWAYQVGASSVRAPLAPAGAPGFRDPAAERAVLDALDVPIERFGLRRSDTEQEPAPGADLGELDTMRFTTEALPLLVEATAVEVEVRGEPAEYREVSDSLHIGVSTDDVPGDADWFDLGISITVEGREVPFTDVFVALASDQSHLLLPDGAFFSLQKPELTALRTLIEEARALQDAPLGPLRISRFQAGLWDELTEVGVVERQATAWKQSVAGLLSAGSLPATELPPTLCAQLRPYQRDGFAWLAFLWQTGLGGVLADDMGLGKTLQALALICHAKRADPDGHPFLIVAPTSVVSNWVSEAARFAPDLAVVSITDTLRRRGQDLDEIVAGADVVITSYTLFRLDIDAHSSAGWSGLILDEAQYAKNHQAKIHQCARRLAAPFKLAITGTPMENNLMELWALLAITAPGLFPSPTRFRDHFAKPIEKQGDAERLAALRRRIKPLIKRRTKENVAADLPSKQEQVLEVELEPRHRTIYGRQLQRERQKILGLIDDVNRHRFTILRSLTVLRQLSLHAGLVDDSHADVASSKIDALLEHLRDVIDGGHRALVFSQFTGFLAHVRKRLDAAGIDYCYLDGRTRKRAAVVQRFKGGSDPVFLISLKAGGSGLNLPEADYCFLLDPWWNPATEAQAVDRAHRIGQTRNVMVYRLVAKETIEEKVMALKTRKAELFSGVMDDGDVFGSSLDADDIRALLN